MSENVVVSALARVLEEEGLKPSLTTRPTLPIRQKELYPMPPDNGRHYGAIVDRPAPEAPGYALREQLQDIIKSIHQGCDLIESLCSKLGFPFPPSPPNPGLSASDRVGVQEDTISGGFGELQRKLTYAHELLNLIHNRI